MKAYLVTAISCIAFLSGCASETFNQAMYENVQLNRIRECESKFEAQAREDCMRGLAVSFAEYQKQREALLKSENN